MSLGTDWELTLIGMCATPPTTAWRALLSKDTIKLCATCCFLEDDDDAFPPLCLLKRETGRRQAYSTSYSIWRQFVLTARAAPFFSAEFSKRNQFLSFKGLSKLLGCGDREGDLIRDEPPSMRATWCINNGIESRCDSSQTRCTWRQRMRWFEFE